MIMTNVKAYMEPDEVFEVILASPKNGLTIGQPAKGEPCTINYKSKSSF